MTLFYGYKRLRSVEDWRGLAGAEKWVAGRSAYELAQCWQKCGGLSQDIADVFEQSPCEVLRGLTLDLCLVEKPVFLDTRTAPSMTDLMAYGRNAKDEAIVLGVEGKADEPFASRISAWVRGDERNEEPSTTPRPTRLRRLEFLSKHLAMPISTESSLRYQLLHRTVSTILEAQLHGAVAAVVLAHVFGEEESKNFWTLQLC